jgi:hypothetical protein
MSSYGSDRRVRDTQDCRDGQRLERRRWHGLHHRMEIAHVARHVHRRDLARSFAILVEAADDPGNHQTGMLNTRSKRNEVAIRLHLLGMPGEVENSLLLFVGQNGAAGQPVEERLKIGSAVLSHDALPMLQAGALNISQAPTACGRNDR